MPTPPVAAQVTRTVGLMRSFRRSKSGAGGTMAWSCWSGIGTDRLQSDGAGAH